MTTNKEIVIWFAIVWIFLAAVCFVAGLHEVITNRKYGKDDIDYQHGKLLMQYCWIPPLLAKKLIDFWMEEI